MRLIYFILAMLALPVASIAQKKKKPYQANYLKIGDRVPDGMIRNMVNYKTSKARISDFKGKLLIIDFWGPNCKGCILYMPDMQKLQEQFKDKIQILLVTDVDSALFYKTRQRNEYVRNCTVPMVYGDTTFHRLFEFNTVPTHAWISPEGKVVQLTNGHNTTAANISKYLAGQEVKLAVKAEKRDFDYKQPLIFEGGGRQRDKLKYYSYLMGLITDSGEGRTYRKFDDSTANGAHIYHLNLPLLTLIRSAYSEEKGFRSFIPDSRILIECADKVPFRGSAIDSLKDDWMNKYIYSYELVVPFEMKDRLFKFMQQDLKRYFTEYEFGLEKRRVKCLVLKKTGNLPESAGGPLEEKQLGDDPMAPTGYKLRYMPFRNILTRFENAFYNVPTPVIDETGIDLKYRIDMDINCKHGDRACFLDTMKRYGLEVFEEDREIEMLVIKDAK